MPSRLFRRPILCLVAGIQAAALFAAPQEEKSEKGKKPPTTAQKIEELEGAVRRLKLDLAGCQQEKALYRKGETLDSETVAIAKQRDDAVEAASKSGKEATRLQKELADLQLQLATKGPAVPAVPPEELARQAKALQDTQGALTQVQAEAAQAQAQAKALATERNALNERLQRTADELGTTKATLTLTQATLETTQGDLTRTKSNLEESKAAYEDLSKVQKATKEELTSTQGVLSKTQGDLSTMTKDRNRWQAVVENRLEGALVHLTPAIVPAQPMNYSQVLPEKVVGITGKVKGVIVVNCYIGVDGKVRQVRMVQPLPGSSYDIKELNKAYEAAATRLIFSPATSSDGKIRYQVWQGVGFLVDE